jgi:hypothetical protein
MELLQTHAPVLLDKFQTQVDKAEQRQAVLLALTPLLFVIELQLTQTSLIVVLLAVIHEQVPLDRVRGEGQ